MNDWSDEETDNPLLADDRNFYKVEKWTKDGTKVDRMLYAGNNLDRAKELFAWAIKAPAADQADDQTAGAGARVRPQLGRPGEITTSVDIYPIPFLGDFEPSGRHL